MGVQVLHALRLARTHYALVHGVDRIAHGVRECLVPRLAEHVVAAPVEQALGGGVHVGHHPVAVVGDEALEQALEVVDGVRLKGVGAPIHSEPSSARSAPISAGFTRW